MPSQRQQAEPKQEVYEDPEIQRAKNVAKAKRSGAFDVVRQRYNKAAAREGKQMDEEGNIVGLDSTPTQTLYAKTPTGRYKPAAKVPLAEATDPTQEELDAQRKSAIKGKYAKGQSVSDDSRLEAGLPDTPRLSSADIAAARARKEQAEVIATQEAEQAAAREAALTTSKEKKAAEVNTHKAYANSLKTKLMLAQKALAPLEAAEKAAQTNLALPKPDKAALLAARARHDAILKQVDEADTKVLESSLAYQKHLDTAAEEGAKIDVFKAGIKTRKAQTINGVTVNTPEAVRGTSYDTSTGRIVGGISTEAKPDPQQPNIFRNTVEDENSPQNVDKNSTGSLLDINDPAKIKASKLMQQRMQLAMAEQDPNVRHYAQKDVEARMADPVKWEAAQYATIQESSDEDLAGKLQLMPQVIAQGQVLLQQSQTDAQAEQELYQQRLEIIAANNAKDQGKPFTMADTKVNTATGERWHTAHLNNYEATIKQANEAQAKALESLKTDENELNRDVAIHNARIIEAKRREDSKKAAQDKKREGVLRGLEAEGKHGLAGDLALINAEQKEKADQINPFIERGSDEHRAAQAVIEEETQGRIDKAVKEAAALPAKASELYKTWGRDANNSYANWITNESPYDQGRSKGDSASTTEGYVKDAQRRRDLLEIQADKLGVNPKDLAYQLETQRILDWSKPLTEKADIQQNSLGNETAKKFGYIGEVEPTRTLPNGDVTVNPALGADQAEFDAAIKAAPASKEGKEAARKMWPAYHEAWLEKARETLSGADTVPGVEGYNDWVHRNIEAGWLTKPDGSLMSQNEQTQKYVDAMKGRGNFRKLLDNVGSSLLAGSHDIMTAIYGTGAVLTGAGEKLFTGDAGQISELFSTVGAEKSAQSERLMQAKGMEGTDTMLGSKLLGGAISQTARILPGMAPTMATGSMGGAMLAGAMQTGGMQYADTYRTLIDQGYDHAEAWAKAAPAATYSGVMTAILTKAFPGGITALNNKANQAVLRQSVGDALKSYASGSARAMHAIARGALDEIPQETMDEFNSQMSQAMVEGKNPKQAVASFIANLPELIISTGIAGGLGGLGDMGGKADAQPGINTPTGIAPQDLAAINTAIKGYTGGADATPEEATRTRNLAAALVKFKAGTKLAGLTQTELAAVGYERKADKIVPIKDAPQSAYEQDGKVVITDPAIQEINDAIPATNILGLKTEEERLDEINNPPQAAEQSGASGTNVNGGTSEGPAPAAGGDSSMTGRVPASAGANSPVTQQTPAQDAAANSATATPAQVAASVDASAHEAATSPLNDKPQPTAAQKQAGNYPMGKLNISGLSISIENPSGSTRDWKNEAGESGTSTINGHYGYIKGTVGHDGDHIDALVKEGTPTDWDGTVYVIKQLKSDGKTFDEFKTYIGFDSEAEAKAAYRSNYQKGWKGYGGARPVMMKDLAELVKSGALKNPSQYDKSGAANNPASGVPSGDNLLRLSNAESAALKSFVNSPGGNANLLSNGGVGQAILAKLNSLIQRPAKAAEPVNLNMVPLGHDLKIVDGVVQSIPVTVVNNLLGGELSSKKFLHNNTVFEPLPANTINNGADKAIGGGATREGADVSASGGSADILHKPTDTRGSSNVNSVSPSAALPAIEAQLNAYIATLKSNKDKADAIYLRNKLLAVLKPYLATGLWTRVIVNATVPRSAEAANAGIGMGVLLNDKQTLTIHPQLLLDYAHQALRAEGRAKADEMIERGPFHELAHTLDPNSDQEASDLWNLVDEKTQRAFAESYFQGIEEKTQREDRVDSWVGNKAMHAYAGREYFRAQLEKALLGSISEEVVANKALAKKLYAMIQALAKAINDFASTLKDRKMAGEITAKMNAAAARFLSKLPPEVQADIRAKASREGRTLPVAQSLPAAPRPALGKAPPSQRIAIAKGMAGGPAYAEFATATDADAYRWYSNMRAAMNPGKNASPKAKAAIASSLLARVAEATDMEPEALRTHLIAYNKVVREQAKVVAEGEVFHAPRLEDFIAKQTTPVATASEATSNEGGGINGPRPAGGSIQAVDTPTLTNNGEKSSQNMAAPAVSEADDRRYMAMAQDPVANRDKLQAMVDAVAKAAGLVKISRVDGDGAPSGYYEHTKAELGSLVPTEGATRRGNDGTLEELVESLKGVSPMEVEPLVVSEEFDDGTRDVYNGNHRLHVWNDYQVLPKNTEIPILGRVDEGEAIARDEQGDVIPLSERFNPSSDSMQQMAAPTYRSPTDMLAATKAQMQGGAGAKPAGLSSMFNPQAKRPATGERTLFEMPKQSVENIHAAYDSAVVGKSSAYITLDELYDALKAKEPATTERQMGDMLRKMDENGQASLEISEDSATTARNLAKYGLRMGTVPASGVAIHPRESQQMAAPFTASVEIEGKQVKTGTPITFNYLHNKSSYTKTLKSNRQKYKPSKEDMFDRGYEPSGQYMVESDGKLAQSYPDDYKTGKVTFENPIVIEAGTYGEKDSWKRTLSDYYGDKTGKRLSMAVLMAGHDGIITVSNGHTGEIVDLTSFDPKKAMYMAAPAQNNLAVIHNISEAGLRHALKIGGLAAPSVAIIRSDRSKFTGFGGISLLASHRMIDPQRDSDAKVFNTDAYSPRYPSTKLVVKSADRSKIMDIFRPYYAELQAIYGSKLGWTYEPHSLLEKLSDRGFREMEYSDIARYAHLRDTGKLDRPTSSEVTLNSLINNEEARKVAGNVPAWVESKLSEGGVDLEDKIMDGYTYSGKQRLIDHNLANVLKILKRKLRDGEGFNYGVPSIRAATAKQFKKVSSIQADRDKIVTAADMESLKEQTNAEFSKLADEARAVRNNATQGFGWLDQFSDDLKSMIQGGSANWKYLRDSYGDNVEIRQKMAAFIDKLKHMPTEYFEGKIRRIVAIQEFDAAVAPDNLAQDLRDGLKRKGIAVTTYPSGDEEARSKAIADTAASSGLLFMAPPMPQRQAFYSKLAQVIEAKMPVRADAKAVRGMIGNQSSGVKPEEIKWSGINQWLEGKEGLIEKADVLAYLNGEGAVRFVEHRLSDDKGYKTQPNEAETDYAGHDIVDVIDPRNGFTRFSGTPAEARNWIDEENGATGKTPKYSQYQLPGGENYREVVLAMPVEPLTYEEWSSENQDKHWFKTADEPFRKKQFALNIRDGKAALPSYTSNHFTDVPNYVAHARLNDRTDSEGKAGTFIEEIQSDRGQALRQSIPLRELREPDSIRETFKNLFGFEPPADIPLSQMDGSVLSAIQNKEIFKAIVSLLPVEVMNQFKGGKTSIEKSLSNPAMVFSTLPIDTRSTVLQGVFNAAETTLASIRAKLLSAIKAGGDIDLLPTLKASELSNREVVSLLAPDALYHSGLGQQAVTGNMAGLGTKEPLTKGKLAIRDSKDLPANDAEFLKRPLSARSRAGAPVENIARLDKEGDSTSIADALNWHSEVSGSGIEYHASDIPSMPYQKTWPLQMFKRALAEAVSTGKQWIGWTTGETQNSRYDLSQQVDSLLYDPDNQRLIASKDGQRVMDDTVAPDKLPDYIGKEPAKKLLEAEKNGAGNHTLKGDQLKIEAVGMKGFYDTILPKEVAKYVKQWGGAVKEGAVQSVVKSATPSSMDALLDELDDDGNIKPESYPPLKQTQIWRVDITPSMAAGVEAGQALFMAAPSQQQQANIDAATYDFARPAPPEDPGHIRNARYIPKRGLQSNPQLPLVSAFYATNSLRAKMGQTIRSFENDWAGFFDFINDQLPAEKRKAGLRKIVNKFAMGDKPEAKALWKAYAAMPMDQVLPADSERVKEAKELLPYLENLTTQMMGAPADHLKAAAVQFTDEQGEDWMEHSVRGHAAAEQKLHDALGYIPHYSKVRDGFITYGGKFLQREDAYKRAIQTGQYFDPKGAVNDSLITDAITGLAPQTFNEDGSLDWNAMGAPKDQGDLDSRVLKRLADQLPEDDYLDQLDTAHSESFPEGSEGDWLRALQKENTTPDTVKAWDKAARKMIAADPQAVIDEIVNNFYEGKSFGSPELALAGSILSADVLKQAQLSGDEAQLRKARAFSYAVGAGETQAGRELRALNNPHKSNRERVAEVIANLFTTPPPAVRAKIANAPSPSAKLKKIAELQKRVKELEKQVVAGDKAAQKKVAAVQKELADALRVQDKAQLVDEALAKREKKVKEALANEGLTVEDVLLTPDDRLAAQDSEIVQRARARHTAAQQKALLWIGRGFSDTDVAKFSGMERGAVATLREDYRNNSLKPEIAKEIKGGRSILEVIKDSFKKAFGINMAAPLPWSNVQRVQPTPPKPPKNKAVQPPKVEDTVADEIDRMLDILAPNARMANGNSLLAAVVKGKNGTRVTIQVPFDADDFKSVYRVARAISISEASGFDKMYEYWINNLLSGPQTNFVNIIGNTLSVGIQYLAQRPLETVVNLFTRDDQSAQFGEWGYIAKGVATGLGEAWQNAVLAYTVEADPTAHRYLNEPMQIGFTPSGDVAKMGGYRGPSVKGAKGRIIRIPGRLLRMMDAMFKTFILHAEVGAMAYRLGKIEQRAGRIGATGADLQVFIQDQIATKGSKSWMMAMRTATDLTFQDENWLTDIAKNFTQGADKFVDKRRADAAKAYAEDDTELGHSMELRANAMYFTAKLMSIIFPFVRTPSNILRMGVRKSPLGSLLLPLHFIQMIRQGVTNKIKGKDFLESYPKGVLVKLLAEQTLAWMVTMGLMSAIEGDDDDDKKRFIIVGGRPWKDSGATDAARRDYGGTYLLIWRNDKGEETRIPFGRYEPVATLLGTTADAVRRLKERARRERNGEPGANMEDAVKALMGDFVNQAGDKSFLQGIAGVMKEIESLENSGDLSKGIKETAWKATLSAIVPNLIRQIMRNTDDKVRDSKKKGDWYDAFPMGSNAEPVIDLFGRDVEKGGDPFTRILFPVANKQQPTHPITPLIHRWNSKNTADKIEPTPMNRSGFYIYNTDGKTKIPLVTPQEKAALQRVIGSNLRTSAATVAENIKANGGELPENFDKVVDKIITAARTDARKTAIQSSPFLAAKQKQP